MRTQFTLPIICATEYSGRTLLARLGGADCVYMYAAAGLCVGSEIELPGMIGTSVSDAPPDAVIRLGDVPDELSNAAHHGPNWQIGEKQVLLRIPNVARFLVAEGREIRVAPENGTAPDEVAIFLIGTVLGILLHQRAHVVLHASAVKVGDKAVLFCGPSGAGKSTLAAALGKHGYPVIADDFCTIGYSAGEQPLVLPDGRSLKLWEEATEKLNMQPGAQVRPQLKKYYVEPDATASEPAVVGALYELAEVRPPLMAGIETPNIAEAALLVRRNAYRRLLVARMGQQSNYFEAATRLVNAAGIYRLVRPIDFEKMDTVIDWLEEHWIARGLLPKAN